MARDYKNTQPKKTARKKSSKTGKKKSSSSSKKPVKKGMPAWLWFLVGMLVMFAFFQGRSYLNNHSKPSSDTPAQTEPYSSRESDLAETTDIPVEPDDAAAPEEPFEIKKDPRFTFYEQLPKDEVIIPQEALEIEVDKNKDTDLKPLEAVTKSGSYILQTGSFKNFSDADRRKAELALLGLQTSIQKVAIDGVNWYRVRVGPFTDLEKLNQTRQDLRSGGVDALVIRIK